MADFVRGFHSHLSYEIELVLHFVNLKVRMAADDILHSKKVDYSLAFAKTKEGVVYNIKMWHNFIIDFDLLGLSKLCIHDCG
jgi:hypothetical protein